MTFSLRTVALALLTTTALTSIAFGQTAPVDPTAAAAPAAVPAPAAAPQPAAPVAQAPAPSVPVKPIAAPAPAASTAPQPKQAAAPQPSAPAAKPVDFGAVTAKAAPEPQVQRSVPLAQPGLTASPTDYSEAQDRAPRAPSAPSGGAAQPTGAASSALANAAAGTGAGVPSVGIGNAPFGAVTPGGVNRQDVGGGYMIQEEAKKTRSTVTRDAIDKQSVTSNPYQSIELLPGVVAASSDNTGLNGGNIRLRGFNSDKVGLTIEGMPVNDSGSYSLFPQEYVDAENISQISLAQGTPDLDSPHVGSTGGVVNIYMRDPSKTAGGFTDFSVGSNNLKRVFVRGETGQIGAFRSFISYSHLTKDNWAGPGKDERSHLDFKTVMDISKGNTIRFSAIYNEAVNGFYNAPTMAQFSTLPSNTSAATGRDPTLSTYYGYRINPFKNLILSAPSNFTITDKLRFDTIPYFWMGFGNGGGVSNLTNNTATFSGPTQITSPNWPATGVYTTAAKTTGVFYNPSITETYRPGIINKFTYAEGDHKIVGGNWLEIARHRQSAPYAPVSLDNNGVISDPFGLSGNITIPTNATCGVKLSNNNTIIAPLASCPGGFLERRDQNTVTTTNALFVGDTWKATKDLTIDFGVKQVYVHRVTDNYLPNAADPHGILNDTATLPTAGVSYKLNDDNKVFANYGTSFRSAPNFTLISSYGTNNGLQTSVNPPPAERGRTFEIGHRYQGPLLSTSVSAFNGYFSNYQQSSNIIDPSGGSATVNATINAGRVTNYGVNAEVGTRPIYNFRPYVSAELLRTQILDNIAAGKNDFLPTSGKQLPGAPNFSMGIGLDYDNNKWFGNVGYKYLGQQYATLMNDQAISGFGRINAAIGYRFENVGFLKAPELKLNLFNLANARQLTGVFGVQNNALATTGVNGTVLAGSNPTYYQGQGFSGLLTFKSGF